MDILLICLMLLALLFAVQVSVAALVERVWLRARLFDARGVRDVDKIGVQNARDCGISGKRLKRRI